jgi:3-dehydroquinate dehydratase/shikimate dehydrogenase
MKASATLVGVLTSAGEVSQGGASRAQAQSCHWIEVRADLIPELDPADLRERCGGRPVLYTLRSHEEGGHSRLPLAQRHRQLRMAAEACDFVTLEGERDLVSDVLKAITPERRIISWRGSVTGPECLEARLGKYARTPARLFRFEVECGGAEDGLAALQFLHGARRADVTAYAEGASGGWTRVLAPRLGAPIAFASLREDGDGVDFEPTIGDLVVEYGLPDLYPAREIFAIVGRPVSGSLSPRLHNATYRANGLGRMYLSFSTVSFQRFWQRLVAGGAMERIGLPIKGLTVASPHKEAALEVAMHRAPLCRQCVASNLLVRKADGWTASTTDPEGIFHNTTLGRPRPGVKVAVVGCGGSGRIAAAALSQAGTDVTLVNRGADRGRWAAGLLGLPFVPLESFSALGYSALVNATPLGRNGERFPVTLAELDPRATVVDLVYRPAGETALVEQARALGHHVVDGRLVLLAQTRQQYFLMTGETMPANLARRNLGLPPANGRSDSRSPHHDQSHVRLAPANFEEGGTDAE